MFLGVNSMLSAIKRHEFWVLFLVALCICVLTAIYCYVNGQAMRSAHNDEHWGIAALSIYAAVVLAVIFAVKKQTRKLKYFYIPIMFAVFAGFYVYIGNLFECCLGG